MELSEPFHGDSIGPFLIRERIAQGGMAAVFLATDERLNRKVALKLMAPALAADDVFRQRFAREWRTAAAVDHPHIIPVYDAGEADGYLYLAMRYVSGGDVRSALAGAAGTAAPGLSAQRVASIISPVASALDAAHAAGLVHRDVKPANMLLDISPGRPDHVYLSDFGLSKEALGATGLTGTGQFLGTVDYAAPEQIDGQPLTGATDQYALGCAAFELLTGEPPFRRDQAMAVLLAHLSQPPPRPTARRPDLPAAVDQVFARVLAKAPGDRFRGCGEFADALRAALRLAPYDPAGLPSAPARAATEAASPVRPGQPNFQMKMGSYPLRADGPRTGQPVTTSGRWRTAVIAAAAAVVVTGGILIAINLLSGRHATAGGAAGASHSAAAGLTPAAARGAAAGLTPTAAGAPAGGPTNVWIAQLASVPLLDGTAGLDTRLASVRRQVPGARVLLSAGYASLRAGFWVIYYDGGFADGTAALDFCAAHGRGTANLCLGRYLSHYRSDFGYQCYPPPPGVAARCNHP